MSNRTVFLDRDGTLVHDEGFLRDPAMVRLQPEAAPALRRLREAGWKVIVVTNQSGIARGLITREEYDAVAARVLDLLQRDHASVDATFVCPHYEPVSGPCPCRKPGVAHYLTAAERFALTLEDCVWVGDRLTDLAPAEEFGGRAILVRTGEGAAHEAAARAQGFPVVSGIGEAGRLVLTY